MKKYLAIILPLVLIVIKSNAQEIGFGIKAGLNYTKITGDFDEFPGPSDSIANFRDSVGFLIASVPQFGHILNNQDSSFSHSSENKIGAHGGIFFNIPISENFSVQPEIIFSMKGASSDYKSNFHFTGDSTAYITHPVSGDTLQRYYFEGDLNLDYDVIYNINLYYIDIPILAKYKFNNGITISAGPYLSFLAASREKYETTLTGNLFLSQKDLDNNTTQILYDTTQTVFVEEIIKSNERLQTFQAGFTAALGYEFPFGLGIHAGYSGALTELFKNEEDEGFKNSVFHFSLSYRIFNDLLRFE